MVKHGRVSLKTFRTSKRISGLTHSFYRYPATTSPDLIRDLILKFSEPGDVVLDPFMGGGTTIVEAIASGRQAVGFDVNPLAILLSRAKTTPVPANSWEALARWASSPNTLAITDDDSRDARAAGLPWRLRRSIASALATMSELDSSEQRALARCALLRTIQWALEGRDSLPGWRQLQVRLLSNVELMRVGMESLVTAAASHGLRKQEIRGRRTIVQMAAEEADTWVKTKAGNERASLVLTSPPYPGVHVLYHRWQIHGRRETAAPYWITNRQDGHGPGYYTMGGRSEPGKRQYFERLGASFVALRTRLKDQALVVQLVAFNDAKHQLPLFLQAMDGAGYDHVETPNVGGRMVRRVPNRRWYARDRAFDASREYLLVHTPKH